MLQRVAACCSVLQRVAGALDVAGGKGQIARILHVCCSVLQRVAACCSVLQRIAGVLDVAGGKGQDARIFQIFKTQGAFRL